MTAKDRPNALVVGGTSGLGLELALLLARTHEIVVTGRRGPKHDTLRFHALDLGQENPLREDLDKLVAKLSPIELLIYAAGFSEDGTLDELSDEDITDMGSVGLLAPAMLLGRLLKKQGKLPGFIAVTSTSQKIPRLREPVYAATKAGLAMLANSVSLDPRRVGKVLVAAPSGMNTPFWRNRPRNDAAELLDPKWVAEQILNEYDKDDYAEFKMAFILRDPPRVKVEEKR